MNNYVLNNMNNSICEDSFKATLSYILPIGKIDLKK